MLKKRVTNPAAVRKISAIITGLTQSSTLSNENFEANKVVTFYNAIDNKIKLISNEINGIGAYSIYDVTSKTVQKGTATSNEIELSFSTKGMYIAKFENDAISESLKFVK